MRCSVKAILLLGLFLFLCACQSTAAVFATSTPVSSEKQQTPVTSLSVFTSVPSITETPMIATLAPTKTSLPKPTKSPSTTLIHPDKTLLATKIHEITSQAGGRWHIIIKEINGENLYISQGEKRINIASVVKLPIALLFFQSLENNGITEGQLINYLQTSGTGGRTFDQLLRAMLVKSEEKATEILDEYIRNSINVPAQMDAWDITLLDLVARRYTAEGIATVFERFYLGDFVSPTARELLLMYLGEYTPNDDLRVGALNEVIPDDFQIYNKRGSLLTPYVVADCAILENPNGSDYLIILFAYQGDQKTTYEVLEEAQKEIAFAFWQTLTASEVP